MGKKARMLMEKLTEYVIEVSGLTKQFGDFKAVNEINLRIEKRIGYGLFRAEWSGKNNNRADAGDTA